MPIGRRSSGRGLIWPLAVILLMERRLLRGVPAFRNWAGDRCYNQLLLVVRRLVWDPGNVGHIALHKVLLEEVEDVCHGDPVVQVGKHGRLLVFGPTETGRVLTIVLDPEPEPGVYYPVTARPASRRERAIYAQAQGGKSL